MATRVWTEMAARGWSLREFGRRLSGDGYHVSPSTLVSYRHGDSRMPREFMERCRTVLGRPLDDLFPAAAEAEARS